MRSSAKWLTKKPSALGWGESTITRGFTNSPNLNMKTITTSALSVLVVFALVLGAFAFLQTTPKVKAVGSQATTIGVATTTAAVAVTSSTRLVATTTNALGNGTSYTRVYATICNPNANPVYIRLDGDKAASASAATYVIAAAAGYNVCYELTDVNQYNGSITASSTNQTSTNVLVTQYVQ